MSLRTNIKRRAGRMFSGAAIVCLLISFVLWYITKLSYTYTARVPIAVRVDGEKIKVNCVAEATGYRIFAHRYFLNNAVDVTLKQVHAVPSLTQRDTYVIDPFTLQNIISVSNNDLKVLSLEDIPEVTVKKEE